MSNVLSEEKKQQVIALGRLGWSLRRIQQATQHPPRNCGRLSESRRNRGSAAGRMGTAAHRQNRPRGDHRLWRGVGQRNSGPGAEPSRPAAVLRPALRAVPRSDRAGLVARAATPWRSGRTWWTATASPRGYQSVKRFVREAARIAIARSPRGDRNRSRRRGAGRLRHRSHGARSADRQVPAHAAVRADAGLQPEIAFGCWCSARARGSGPNCMRKRFAGWAAPLAWWCWIICARAC